MITLILLLISGAHASQPHPGACDFPIPNYEITTLARTGISFNEFSHALNVVEAAYAPAFKKWGCPLYVVRSWNDPTPNAQAWRTSRGCFIEMFGGLARHPEMTYAAFMQVALHEIGHHVGGPPRYTGDVMSVEGQADYYSTRHGMPSLGMASKASSMAVARTLAELSGDPMPWRPGPRLPNVSRTMQSHPPAQCRLNTYDSGRNRKARPGCWFKK